MKQINSMFIVGLVALLAFIGGVSVFGLHKNDRLPTSQSSATSNAIAAVSVHEERATQNHQRGLRAEEIKDYDLAVSCFSASLRDRPNHIETLLNRSFALYMINDNEGCRRDAKQVIELTTDPHWQSQAFTYHGLSYWWKEPALAIKDFTEAIRLRPENWFAQENRALAYCESKQWEQAVRDATVALRFRPESAMARSTRGRAYMMLHAYDRAIEDLTQAIDHKPEAFDLARRAYCYSETGVIQSAFKDAQRAIALNPKEALAHLILSKIYGQSGDTARADDHRLKAKLSRGN